MIRFLLAFLLVFCSLSSIAAQPQATGLRLMLFKGPGPNGGPCPPCDQFNRDFDRVPGFAAAIRERFEIVPALDYRKPEHHETFADYDVDRWPMFIVTDQHDREITRITGYEGSKDLWQQLTRVRPVRPSEHRVEAPEPQSRESTFDKQLKAANESLQEEGDALRGKIQLIESDLQRERQRADAIASRPNNGTAKERAEIERQKAEAKAEIDGMVERFRREQDRLQSLNERRRPRSDPVIPASSVPVKTPTAPPVVQPAGGAEMECKDGVCGLPAARPEVQPDSDTVSSWRTVGKWAAMTAITLAAPQFAIPGSIGLTALGFGLNWFGKRKKKGSSHIEVDGRTGVRTETVHVTKRIDYEAEQIREALRRVARRHEQTPNASALIREVEAVAKQLIHGQQVIHEDNQQ